jgi:hypothetical protein
VFREGRSKPKPVDRGRSHGGEIEERWDGYAQYADLVSAGLACYLPRMNSKEGENSSRDDLLLQLLKTPPQPRAERKRRRPQTVDSPNRIKSPESSGEKRSPSA